MSVDNLHPLERTVLPACEHADSLHELVKTTGLKDVEVMRALQWLENKKALALVQKIEKAIVLGENGHNYLKSKLPERRLLDSLKGESALADAAKSAGLAADEINIAIGILKRKAAIAVRKGDGLMLYLTDAGKKLSGKKMLEETFLERAFPVLPEALTSEESYAFNELKNRRDIVRIQENKSISVSLTPEGRKLIREIALAGETVERLTPEMLRTGAWKGKRFRKYDVEVNVPKVYGGKRHFVNQAVDHIKRIWLDLGFKEMRGNIVQTAFWDLDALFVPQDHPARDMQDTFYLKDPKFGTLPKELMKNVKAAHENGGKTGSSGWQYKWSIDIARENLLRTHTTVLSAQTISRLKNEDLPAKFFSVKRVYRNEALSWKHLFEFVQVEGIVIDPNADFRHLKGYLTDFFRKMGFDKVQIRPGHFPYTEPSAEVIVWHPIKKSWVELGGSGIFRPEVVEPLFGEAVPVLAWGLGMERSIMEYYRIEDIRDLYKNDLRQLQESGVWL
jgi:phenylalanyl-tRNA synthetase alpha chain